MIKLNKISDVKEEWQTVYKIKVLVINNRSQAMNYLANLKKSAISEYKKIIKVMKLLVTNEKVVDEKHVKKGKNVKYIYEMRVNKSYPRLFFFYDTEGDSIIICTHGFDKKGDKKKQNQEFKKAEELRNFYFQNK